MTQTKLFLHSALVWAVLAIIKIICFNNNLLRNNFGIFLYLALIAAVTAVVVLRLGVINFFEAAVTGLGWFVLALFFDYLITNRFLLTPAFSHNQVWLVYGIMVLLIFFFASMRNVGLVLTFTAVLILFLLMDGVFGSQPAVTNFSNQTQIWTGYLVMFLSVLVFHKKRHIQIRKELQANHHSHH